MNRKIKIALLVSSIILCFFCLRNHWNSSSENTVYSYHCGWIDWNHAGLGAIQGFVDDFSRNFDKTPLNDTFKIIYGQQGGIKKYDYLWCTYGVSAEYALVKYSADETVQKKMMFQVFKEVSFLFENYQQEVFLGTLKTSAFREGDMMGNLIGFYIACGELTKEEAEKRCGVISDDETTQLNVAGRYDVNASFSPKFRYYLEKQPPVFPASLEHYNQLVVAEGFVIPLDTIKWKSFLGGKFVMEE